MGKVCKVEKVRSTFHTFHDYLNFCGEKKDDRLFTIYVFWSLMGYWPMLIINLIAGIVAEIIIGSYEDDKRVAAAVATGMFIISMHAMTFVKILGPEKLVEVFTVFSPEQAQYMYTFFTPKAMLISIAINIVLVIVAGIFGMYINNKFFEKRKEKGIL